MDERLATPNHLIPQHSVASPKVENTQNQYRDIYVQGNAKVVVGNNYGGFGADPASEPVNRMRPSYDDLHQSLLFDRVGSRMLEVKKPLSKTCEWLFLHETWQEWNKDEVDPNHNGFLWIKGKPGCGKSTLMKTALERKRREVCGLDVNPAIIHYFFNARAKASLEKSTLGLYRWLTYQILEAYPHLHKPFLDKFLFKNPRASSDLWTKEELQDFLHDIVTLPQSLNLWIFIDALDEDERQNDAREMIEFLVDLAEQALEQGSSCSLHVCLSSRHYPYISIAKGLSVVVEEVQEHAQAIETYVNRKLRGQGREEIIELKADICKKAANVFLWAVLVVDHLNELDDSGTVVADMKARLETIPGDLNTLFRNILTRNDSNSERTTRLLQWVLFSYRPLTPLELYTAIEYSLPHVEQAHLPSDNHTIPSDRLNRLILNYSRGLVQVTSTKSPVVQLIHETVREFLVVKGGLILLQHVSATNLEGPSHDMLKTCCSRYIASSKIPSWLEPFTEPPNLILRDHRSSIYDLFPFLEYAIFCVYEHADQAGSAGLSQLEFWRSQVGQDGYWAHHDRWWWNLLCIEADDMLPSTVTLPYLLASRNLPWSLKYILIASRQHIDDVCANNETALINACYNDRQAIVEVLLDYGADVNKQVKYAENALQIAARHGRHEIVQYLLQHGANINQLGKYGTALHAAVESRNEDTVRFLIGAGADVNAQGGECGTVLHAAAAADYDCDKVVQLLINAGADVNAEGGQYGDALTAAVMTLSERTVAALLEAGAMISIEQGHFAPKYGGWRERFRYGRIMSTLHERGARFSENTLEDLKVVTADAETWYVYKY